jgi:hypothetical protein
LIKLIKLIKLNRALWTLAKRMAELKGVTIAA